MFKAIVRVPEVIEVEPIVRGMTRVMREPVGESLHDLFYRGLAPPTFDHE